MAVAGTAFPDRLFSRIDQTLLTPRRKIPEKYMSINLSSSRARFLFQIFGPSLETSVVCLWAHEALSTTFTVMLTLASPVEIGTFDDIIGKESLLTIVNSDPDSGGDRYFHGVVRKIEHTGMNGRFFLYDAEVVPTLFQLSLRKNSRIFQRLHVQDIIKQVLQEGGIFSDRFRFALTSRERLRKFCVQYRETDLDFITRLLEEEGIFYFFEHYKDKHVLVMGDDSVVHLPIAGKESITCNSHGGMVAERESIEAFSFSQRMRSGVFTHRNFNFKKPSLDLTARKSGSNPEQFEVYDYPALHVDPERGGRLAMARMEELGALQKQGHGRSSSCRLIPGYTFTLTDHDARSLDGDYLIIDVCHSGEQPQTLEEKAGGGASYGNTFRVIPAKVPFRPRITQEKPFVRGVQTAIVVGPPGEEIYTDTYGRVKVQFHWDREGKRNDRSSCWLRPAQGWGGGGWGMVFLPRIGDEVLVDFIEGDPDRPIIVGSAYNEENLPLYELPANKTVSTLKTRSYPKGSRDNYNELRFEDKIGNEEIFLQGEKDWNILIKNDKGQVVGRDESLRVVNNRTKHVGVNQAVDIGSNHTETIGANKSVTIVSNRTETIDLNHAETVGAAKELTIGGLYQVSVGGIMNQTVMGAKTEEVGITKDVFVGAHMTEQALGNRDINVGESFSTTVARTSSLQAKSIIFEADDDIVLKTGDSLVSMKSNGDIVISGGTLESKATGENVIKGARISEN
jgi:type VI secretion system secreted protein VgrG